MPDDGREVETWERHALRTGEVEREAEAVDVGRRDGPGRVDQPPVEAALS
jgi:hypothetical protein